MALFHAAAALCAPGSFLALAVPAADCSAAVQASLRSVSVICTAPLARSAISSDSFRTRPTTASTFACDESSPAATSAAGAAPPPPTQPASIPAAPIASVSAYGANDSASRPMSDACPAAVSAYSPTIASRPATSLACCRAAARLYALAASRSWRTAAPLNLDDRPNDSEARRIIPTASPAASAARRIAPAPARPCAFVASVRAPEARPTASSASALANYPRALASHAVCSRMVDAHALASPAAFHTAAAAVASCAGIPMRAGGNGAPLCRSGGRMPGRRLRACRP